jgi:hypothetical protein
LHQKELDCLLTEYFSFNNLPRELELEIIEVVLFVEMTFDIVLKDVDFTYSTLCTPEALRSLLCERMVFD